MAKKKLFLVVLLLNFCFFPIVLADKSASVGSFTGDPLASPPQLAKKWENIGLDISIGATYLEGNVEILSFMSKLSANAHFDEHSFYIDASNMFTESNEKRILNKINGSFLYAYTINDNLNFYVSSAHTMNEFSKLDYRTSNGIGICVHNFWKPLFSVFLFSFGFNVENEWFDNDDQENHVTGAFRWTFQLSVTENLKIGSDFIYVPVVDDAKDFRIYEEAYAEFKITKDELLAFRVSLISEYDSQPQPDVEKSDTGIYVSLVFHLGK